MGAWHAGTGRARRGSHQLILAGRTFLGVFTICWIGMMRWVMVGIYIGWPQAFAAVGLAFFVAGIGCLLAAGTARKLKQTAPTCW